MRMPKFMTIASYTAEGAKGLIKDGGSGRRAAVEKAITGLGGRLESIYFAFGEDDVFVVSEAPDNVAAAALALAVGSTGLVKARTVVLMTPEEVDQAVKKSVNYKGPGR
jgi:uncharacterized protein with GYD domain